MNARERTYLINSQIPQGKVLTYKTLAILAGVTNSRLIGFFLHQNSYPKIPCYRVVNSLGKVAKTYAFGGANVQRKKLEKDGIVFVKDRLSLDKYLWKPDLQALQKIQSLLKQDFKTFIKNL